MPTEQAGQVVLDERELSRAVADDLAGETGNGPAIVWSSRGGEVVLHLDTADVQLTPGHLRVRLECETAETGRVSQQIHLALPLPQERPNFVATADLVPEGDAWVAAWWGRPLQDAVWATVVRLAGSDADGVAADRGALIVHRAERHG